MKVYLPNGAVRDDAWLQKKLNYISKRHIKVSFSFDVLGLQDIHRNLNENNCKIIYYKQGL